jgi:replicative DNA helicase
MESKMQLGSFCTAPEAEKAVACIASNHTEYFMKVCAEVNFNTSCILDPLLKRICDASIDNSARGKSTEIVVLFESIKSGFDIQFYQLSEILTSGYNQASLKDYIEIVKDASNKRRLLETLSEATASLKDNNSMAVITSLHTELNDICRDAVVEKHKSMRELLLEATNRYEHGEDNSTLIKTGFRNIDEMTPTRRSDFMVIGGEPKSGKTTLGLNFIANMITQDGL